MAKMRYYREQDETNNTADIEAVINEYLEDYADKDEQGYYYIKITPDYRDELPNSTLAEILSSDSPMDAFYDSLSEAYQDSDIFYMDGMFDEVIMYLENSGFESYDIDTDFVSNYLWENVYIKYPYDYFLNTELNCHIIVDSGDGDYDFTLNPSYANNYTVEDEEASIVWLAEQQGYSFEDVVDALNSEQLSTDKFLKSIVREAENTSSSRNALVILCTATLKQLIDFRTDHKNVVVPPSATVGLFDNWNGGGSVLEIELVKPLTIPYDFIYDFSPDVTKICKGYSVDDVYGLGMEPYDTKVKLV